MAQHDLTDATSPTPSRWRRVGRGIESLIFASFFITGVFALLDHENPSFEAVCALVVMAVAICAAVVTGIVALIGHYRERRAAPPDPFGLRRR